MSRVAVATASELAARAAATVAEAGGNAVDCAVAAAMVSVNTEPGVCALAGGGYVTVWPPDADPVTFDGNVAMPGLNRGSREAAAVDYVFMDYGGGIETMIGPASIAVPGTLAALERAWQEHGRSAWPSLLEPAILAARKGFPLSAACHYYLQYSGTVIFGRSEDGFRALHDDSGALRGPHSTVIVPCLADSLAGIAEEGAALFYAGELGARIAEHVQEGGGLLTRDDLASYRAIPRKPLRVRLRDWEIALNPPPAVGGAMLAAMLLAFGDRPLARWDRPAVERLIRVQKAALDFRKSRLDAADDVAAQVGAFLRAAATGRLLSRRSSASTVHTSAVDDSGLACAITASSGYGSGEMPARTGLWLNNCIGELELNRKGFEAGPPGARLPSNMAPTAARNGARILAMGSPGADRITTALHQFLVNFVLLGMDLGAAIAHPRLHLDTSGEEWRLAAEPGLEVPDAGLPLVLFPGINMYFGGVAAAHFDGAGEFDVAADPRRAGGICVAGR